MADYLSSVPLHLRYDIALLYLRQANYDLDLAVESYLADEKWEKEHPIEGTSEGKMRAQTNGRKFGLSTGFSGQL